MSRNYSIAHSAPKDLGNAKMLALIDVQTSQLDFALMKGIGSSPVGSASMVAGHLAVGVHCQSSKIEALHPLVTIGGVYTDYSTGQASPVGSGQAKIAHMSNHGEIYSTAYPKRSSRISSGSTQTIKASSGVVYEFGVAWSDCNTGNTVELMNNLTNERTIVFPSTSGNQWAVLPPGGIALSTSITVRLTVTGAAGASVFVSYL